MWCICTNGDRFCSVIFQLPRDLQIFLVDLWHVLLPHQLNIETMNPQRGILPLSHDFAHHFIDQSVLYDSRMPGSTSDKSYSFHASRIRFLFLSVCALRHTQWNAQTKNHIYTPRGSPEFRNNYYLYSENYSLLFPDGSPSYSTSRFH